MSLLELGKKYGTDKVVHAYLPEYDERFKLVCLNSIALLEIGVFKGGSLRMWRDYFTWGRIFGLDAVEEYCFEERGIQCVRGRQENTKALQRVLDLAGGSFNIIIDDGGHAGEQHVKSFEFLWPHVKPGGWYCIEDAITIFDVCWTKKGDRTILDVFGGNWEKILRSDSDIAEFTVVGCDTQKEGGRNNGLIFFRKAHKEPMHEQENTIPTVEERIVEQHKRKGAQDV